MDNKSTIIVGAGQSESLVEKLVEMELEGRMNILEAENTSPYIFHKNIDEMLLKELEAIQYSHLTTKERNAILSPVRDSLKNPKISRNKPCPCGSGKKYKRCCGK